MPRLFDDDDAGVNGVASFVMSSARAVGPEDRDEVAAMMVALFVEDPSPHQVNLAGAMRTLDVLAREPLRGVVVVLEEAGASAGYAILASFWSNELGGEICVIDELYVKPALRGRGIATWLARALMSRSLAWFRDCVAVELEVTPSNDRARALYERLGFKPKKNSVLRWTSTT